MRKAERRRLERKRFSPELTRLGCLSGQACTVNQWWQEIHRAAEIRTQLHNDGVIDFALTDGDRISELVREYANAK